ncbi:hypothetical protein [Qipengyuania sediminis]|uniref:hypothetical protein n=1 Tax=Qipengyuania sediminis TaxID=1532023 RepID=UPI0010598747|nr:hypothetical protein [Qipengyuania sediminis]
MTTASNPGLRIGWHADSFDAKLASVRYRVIQPMAALNALGLAVERLADDGDPARYDAVIFSKSHGKPALALAGAARAGGVPIVYDLCDNFLAASQARHMSSARLGRANAMLAMADTLSFSTATLAEQLRAEYPDLTAEMVVVPDTIDPPAVRAEWGRGRALAALDRFLAGHPGALHCVWFGNSLGRLSGYVHVGLAAEELRQFSAHLPVTLTVISNDRFGFWRASRRWRVPVHYVPWSLAVQGPALARHRVALIPVERNAYTLGKTINRPATALMAGLGVVASAIPSYEELRPYIFLDDWQAGLAAYARPDDPAWDRIGEAQALLTARYGSAAVAARWQEVIATTVKRVRGATADGPRPAQSLRSRW